ncbi:ADP-forming succinate--CoA ligase subunit beta [Desulforhabdus amnigena]|jgi:succinyl-CoA synthetase beta subunit|uniref:Succinate--CoA ligase [ADP-forming] subunit beta n=1 Tax=Desulforhabdus amnigena TaxID=40218 RepID=A0A9W6FSL7_9BACT|nr:ADP-forming succinate--CoA ligase subunit beta [Desulforhabdus amnigena]NLJ28784.1 ADP-forming succinate--CoA ligase subunit beta [Deltaproteobacteria bacterium]GLI34174.1 succinate--CoA ligase [ADP-forming] subunit beta [Desulforhabdus amnigena]
MKIHEYQAKELFQKYGVPTPRGKAAFSVDEAKSIAAELGSFPVVVKAQIHAGGRGKGGGVKLAKSAAEVDQLAGQILGMTLVTHQTGPEGKLVKKLLIEEGLPIEKELYLSMLPDRGTAKNVIMASEAGGMDIEEVAAKTPEKIIKVYVDPLLGLQGYQARQVAYGLNMEPEVVKAFIPMLSKLYKLFVDYDCSLVEINPLVITSDKRVIALDAKVNFDDNAMFRHKDIQAYRDLDEEDPFEVEASKYNLNYIKLPGGNIGNMVNGAGLAMATMDVIQLAGAAPANFLDVGGGASAEQVENGFRIILSDPNVKGVLINIFGGILRCDILAEGVVEAAKKVEVKVPIIVRMEGTNVEKGRQILSDSGLKITVASDLADAAQKVAAVAKA